MRRIFEAITLVLFVMATTSFSCGQNGPTQPTVTLTWPQSTTPGVTANCVYRGTASKVYTMPALFCSTSPVTTYTDTTVVRGTTYFYAVTAKLSAIESDYSPEAAVSVTDVAPPASLNNKQTTLVIPKLNDKLEAKVEWKR